MGTLRKSTASRVGDYLAKGDRVSRGSRATSAQSSVAGWLAVAVAKGSESTAQGGNGLVARRILPMN